MVTNYTYSYNEIGQLITKTFPDLSAETYLYNKYGKHIATQLDGKNVWELSSCAINNISEVMNTVNKKTNLNIDNTIKSITYGTASNAESLNYYYTYDTNQNLMSRRNGFEKDTFAYDQSDRLIKINNDISLYRQDITYTPFRRPETIADKTLEGKNHKYIITYSPLLNRIKTEYIAYHKNITTYYLPDYEEEISDGITTSRHYIYSPTTGNLVAVNFRCDDKNETYYAVTDNIGSVLKLVDSDFRDKYSATYTPFGLRTIISNDLGYNFPRGFTMHEHLDEFGLINMNARLYDPVLARFISPDPYVQNPANSQNFNRYSYCLNNPLKYTDPSGEFWNLILGEIIGGCSNWAFNGCKFSWKGLGYFSVGALSGALSSGIGGGVGSLLGGGSFVAGFLGAGANATKCFVSGAAIGGASGFTGGFFGGMGNSLVSGNGFSPSMKDGLFEGFIGGVCGALGTGVIDGFAARRAGANFWNGDILYDFQLPNGYLPIYTQSDPTVGCTQETLKSIGDYLFQPVTIPSYTQGEDFAQLAKQNLFDVKTVPTNPFVVGSELLKGNPAAITYDNGGIQHTVGINRITITKYKIIKSNRTKIRGMISVMNPLYRHYQRMSFQSFNTGVVRVVKPWILLCSNPLFLF